MTSKDSKSQEEADRSHTSPVHLPVTVDVHLCSLPANVEVMRELALEALGALPCLVILTKHGLGIHACNSEQNWS